MSFLFLFIVAFLGAITPGPDILFVINNTLRYGILRGLESLAGIATGWIVFFSIIYFGLVHIFSSNLAQIILSMIGCIYLFYISYILMRKNTTNITESNLDSKDVKSNNIYLKGLMINLSNPKAILFFSVIISPYLQDYDVLPSLVVLFVSLSSGFLFVIILCSFFRRFMNDRIFFIIDKICCVLFAFFAIYLAYNAIILMLDLLNNPGVLGIQARF